MAKDDIKIQALGQVNTFLEINILIDYKNKILYIELVRQRNREEIIKRTIPTERYYRPKRPTPRLLVLQSEGHKCN